MNQLTPSPLEGVPIVPPLMADPLNEKLLAVTPLTASLNVALNVRLVGIVNSLAGE